ncbi:MAG: hypothetical protein JRN08_05300 [Nitrososphaerota archaeon]|nr:hypothetical protein [Nitrososphaerota archaeon]
MEGLTQEERSKLIRSVGTHRGTRPLSPVEVGQLFAKALQYSSAETIASEVDFHGTTMVSRFVRLLDIPEEFQPLIDWGNSSGSIPFTAATAVGGLPRGIQRVLLNRYLSGELDVQDLRNVVPILRRGKGLKEAIEEAGKLRPTIVRRHLLIGAVAREDQERVRTLDQAGRDSIMKLALAEVLSPGDVVTARMLPERFSIVTTDSGKVSIDDKSRSAGTTFERLIQERIRKALADYRP